MLWLVDVVLMVYDGDSFDEVCCFVCECFWWLFFNLEMIYLLVF